MKHFTRFVLFSLLLLFGSISTERAGASTIYALNFDKDNNAANSDIALVWTGANFLSRTAHTVIWRYNPRQQNGYYAVAWHTPNDGVWDYGAYSYGTHPWPADDCTANGSGSGLTGNSGSAVHCWEQAGMGHASDYVTSGTSPGYTVVADVWYTQIRRVRYGNSCGTEYEHTFWPDWVNYPSRTIVTCNDSPITGAGSAPAFYFGGSDWSATGSVSSETVAGKMRGFQLYSTGLSDADVATEAANQTSNTPRSSSGVSNVWYMNQNPIPTDITDQSGAGHTPVWRNANRPTQWDSTIVDPVLSARAMLLGVGK